MTKKSKSKQEAPPDIILPAGKKFVPDYRHRTFVEGDVLRTIVTNDFHPDKGKYVYAVCYGTGFGCKPNALGNAIFVGAETSDPVEALKIVNMTKKQRVKYAKKFPSVKRVKKKDGIFIEPRAGGRDERWERYFMMQILVEESP